MAAVTLPLGRDFAHGTLRSLRGSDVPGMLSWMHDPATAAVFARDFMAVAEADALAFVRSSWVDAGSVNLAVAGDAGEYLGTISLKGVDPSAGEAEYAIAVTPEARGTGAALCATRDLLTLAFGGLGLSRVWLDVRESNLRARRFYEKAGFGPCAPVEDRGPGLAWYEATVGTWEPK